MVQGRLDLKPSERRALARAEHVRELQTRQSPPYDRPWSFFDLAEIKLYRGDKDGFLSIVDTCLEQTDDDWQGRTFLDSLRLLQPVAGELPGLAEGIARLEEQLA